MGFDQFFHKKRFHWPFLDNQFLLGLILYVPCTAPDEIQLLDQLCRESVLPSLQGETLTVITLRTLLRNLRPPELQSLRDRRMKKYTARKRAGSARETRALYFSRAYYEGYELQCFGNCTCFLGICAQMPR